jgi:O-6-methylguanine DNA methyltransferase
LGYNSKKEFIANFKPVANKGTYLTTLKNDILKYLSGKPISFKKHKLDLHGTEFQKRVWNVLSTIPYGKVLTYKEVAEKAGIPKAFRAVGSACGANNLPIIIPCHRVIASNGSLGGFSGGLGLKQYLLQLEGAKPKNKRRG